MSKEREENLKKLEDIMADIRSSYYWEVIEERPDSYVRSGMVMGNTETFGGTPNQGLASWVLPEMSNDDFRPTQEQYNAFYKMNTEALVAAHPEWAEKGYFETYTGIPGCPEEPDTQVEEVVVYRLREEFKPGPHPVLFIPTCNGFFINEPMAMFAPAVAHLFGCDIVVPKPRTYVTAKWPAWINDYHATYQWMVNNAEMLNIDPDRVVIAGNSGTGVTSASLAFRLKRYNYCDAPMPRGIFVIDGLWDELETTPSQRVLSDMSYSNFARNIWKRYLGHQFGNSLVGPEAVPNRATIDECRGLPPFLIFAAQDFYGADPAKEFASKLTGAGVWCSFLQLANSPHSGPLRPSDGMSFEMTSSSMSVGEFELWPELDLFACYQNFAFGGVRELFNNDYRRLWQWEED